mgnify:CR=1 FL=1
MTDANAHARIVVADMRRDRFETVVAGIAAAGFDQEQEFSLGENLYCQTYVRRRASDA